MDLMLGFVSIFLSFFIISATASSDSNANRDLYKKISQSTSVSVKDIYEIVYKNNLVARARLQRFAKSRSMSSFQKELEQEVSSVRARCEKHTAQKRGCLLQVEDLKKQIDFFSKLKKSIKTNPKLATYRDLVIFSHAVRSEVLMPSYKKWDQKCSDEKVFSTPACRDQFYEIDIFNSLLQDLARVSYSKAVGQPSPIQRKQVLKVLKRYE